MYINEEWMNPLCKFVGFIIAHFLREMSQKLFPISEERDRLRHLLGISCVFALIHAFFMKERRIYLLVAANGGLMQVVWFWKSSLEKKRRDGGDNSIKEDASAA